MTDNGVLLAALLWMLSQQGKPQPQQQARIVPPQWPTPVSPPPMPAFQSQHPAAPSAETGTPLAELHAKPPTPEPVWKAAAKAVKAADAARAAATRIARSAPHVKAKAKATSPATSDRTAVAAIDLQKVINARGGKVKQDDLYGPKTASAWSALARAKNLPATITRAGPKSAWVATHTYEVLRVPAIP